MRLANVAVAVCIAIVAVTLIGTLAYVNREANLRRHDLIVSCERGNSLRQTVNTLIIQAALADELVPLPIVDCGDIVR